MLEIDVPNMDYFNEETMEFVRIDGCKLQLEHSLLSVSKWESKWCVSFLSGKEKTNEMLTDYVRCMTLNRTAPTFSYDDLPPAILEEVSEYINAPMTATTFADVGGKISREVVTSELIYYWMVAMNIPFECQKWHLNRLLTLIRVTSLKNSPEKKMSAQEIADRNTKLNAERLAKLGTTG